MEFDAEVNWPTIAVYHDMKNALVSTLRFNDCSLRFYAVLLLSHWLLLINWSVPSVSQTFGLKQGILRVLLELV